MAASKKRCKDCVGGSRPAPHPGPRCTTHHREVIKARKAASHGRWVEKTYGITAEEYQALYVAQGRSCFICRRATGRTKRLAVDHDHKTGYVRGLLCGTCNKLLGHLRDDPDLALRIADYLVDPPAFKTIGRIKPSE